MTYNEALDFIWSTPSPSNERISILNRLLEGWESSKGMKYVHVGAQTEKAPPVRCSPAFSGVPGIKRGCLPPHLNTINERFRINGELISDDEFAE